MDVTRPCTIREAAELTGLTGHTLRYYERIGLLADIERGDNGHRMYRPEDIGAIRILTCLRRSGMPIRELQRFAELLRGGDPDGERRRRMLLRHRESILVRQEELRELLRIVDAKIARYTEFHEAWSDPASVPPLDRSPPNDRT